MSKEVPDLLSRFDQGLDDWIGFCHEYSPEDLLNKPSQDSWSLGQMINHIILDTRFHVHQMKLALTDQQNADMTMHKNGIDMLNANSFPDIRIEGHPDNGMIAQPVDIQELVFSLQEIKQEIIALYNTFNFFTSSGKSQHPGLGFFTAKEWLQFTEMHMRHHLRQKKRIDEYL